MPKKVCNLQIKKEEAVVPRGLAIHKSYVDMETGPPSSNLKQFTKKRLIQEFYCKSKG